jgi:5-methylcytosine-specific restriction endonuclease McrA
VINEYAAKHVILQLVKAPEEAHEMVRYLATLDWHQIMTEREQREKRYTQEALDKGGGYCDECKKFSYDPLIFRSYAPAFTGNFCYPCINRLQRSLDVPNEMWLLPCDECHKKVPLQSLWKRDDLKEKYPRIEQRHYGYCSSCLERLIERYTITCPVCGKRTMEWTYKFACNECYVRCPEQSTVAYHNYRAQDMGLPATLTVIQWLQTVKHFNSMCAYCLRKPYTDLEHYIPLTLGGGTTASNCIPACRECNARKSNKHPDACLFPTENIAQIRNYFATIPDDPSQ